MKKPIIYIDMDGVLVDFTSALTKVLPEMLEKFAGEYDNIPGVFAAMVGKIFSFAKWFFRRLSI